uniref:Myb-like DNA-binding domain-containing protein n=3 Tax=Wuchereria bancrofti TaxID=6293 RepID=A0A1I8ECR8_WUCBA
MENFYGEICVEKKIGLIDDKCGKRKEDMLKQNGGEILGPLEIDVSEMATTTSAYGCDSKKLQRESPESLRHRMALSDGAVIAMSSGATLISTAISSSSVAGSSNTVCPVQLNRKSNGKPENACQLITTTGQKTSIGSRAPYETRSERTLAKGRSVSVTTFGNVHDCSGGGSGSTIANVAMSLKQFASQLRSPRFYEPVTNLKCFVPYTPPPMLSPMRRGSGLFWKISQNSSPSKISMLQSSQENNSDKAGASDSRHEIERDEEPIGKRLRRCIRSTLQSVKEGPADEEESEIRTPIRKNGLCHSSQFFDARLLHLEALRKESNILWNNSNSSGIPSGAANLPSPRKLSISSDGDALRKTSSCSDFGEEICVAPESDAVPHINCGRDYQVKVKKWADRAISDEERDAIPDRDDAIFDCNIIDHLDDSAVEAYELLAYSKAVPRPGRNRELALHLLMENKGNIQEAVLDLMRSDTLDWSQYPIIYNSIYTDTSSWTPEEISFFQDAIYKGEKDFHQVASDLGNKTVKQCVEFYYMWKKACPDDYRKLRNLRRKRQLLEIQQQLDLMESYNLRSSSRPVESGELSGSEEGSDLSAISHDADKLKSGHSDRNISCSAIPRNYSVARFGELPHSTVPSSMVMGNNDTPRSFPQLHRTPVKKGAQPAADGFFHCRLCDKYFEKVKSLNAHMKSHAMKARAEAEATQSQLSLQHHDNSTKITNVNNILEKTMSTKSSPMTDSMSFIHHHHHHHHQKEQQQILLNTDPLKASVERPTMQVTNNFPAASTTATIVASEQHPFGPVIGKSGGGGRLGQDLFAQTSLIPEHHQFTQNTLMSGSLGLAAHQALNQSLTAASVLNQFPQAQALQFLNNLQNPAITH